MTHSITDLRRRYNLQLLGIFAAAVGVRVMYVLLTIHALPGDTDSYRGIAENLLGGHGYSISADMPTAFRPPGYPLFIAVVERFLGGPWSVIWAQCILGGVVALIAGSLARRLVGDLFALVAAGLVAIDPYQVARCTEFMSEVFFSFAVLAALALFMRAACASSVRNYAAAGIAAGAAAMTRPEFLLFIPGALFAALLWGQRKHRLLCAVVFIVASALLPAVWAARNKAALGEWIFTTTHGGYTHRLSYNSIFYDEVVNGPSEVWDARSLKRWQARLADETSGMSEIAADEDNYKMASGFIMADWRRAATVGLYEAGAFWKLTPYGSGPYTGVVLCVFFLFLCIAGAAGVYVAWGRGPFVPITLYILTLETLVHVYYWGNIRMRVPLHAILCVLAACAIAAFFARKAPVGATVRAVADETAYSPAG